MCVGNFVAFRRSDTVDCQSSSVIVLSEGCLRDRMVGSMAAH
jgi:hypothetical protein